jgi:lipoyl(octanoyl) transferase
MSILETRMKILSPIHLRHYTEMQAYMPIYEAMKNFTYSRQAHTPDECWILQHTPVYTLGLAGKLSHILNPGNIEVCQSDRGGQVTYHGPGQLILYLLLDLKRRRLHIKSLVYALEASIIAFLAAQGIDAQRRERAPGVYVGSAKIAALGLRIRHGYSYHGLSLNVDMDLSPFTGINPCGYPDLAVTQLRDLGCMLNVDAAAAALVPYLHYYLDNPYVETISPPSRGSPARG